MKEKVYEIIANGGIWFLRKFFPEYFAKDPLTLTDRYFEYPYALKHLPSKPSKILDVGCCGSMFPLIMNAIGHQVCGIDIREYPSKDIYVAKCDICDNHFKDEVFDVVTAISTIEHIGLKGRYGVDSKSTDAKALTQIYRILKVGGTFIMTVPYGNYRETKFHKIYDAQHLDTLLTGFNYSMRIIPSPEADYKLALIFAIK